MAKRKHYRIPVVLTTHGVNAKGTYDSRSDRITFKGSDYSATQAAKVADRKNISVNGWICWRTVSKMKIAGKSVPAGTVLGNLRDLMGKNVASRISSPVKAAKKSKGKGKGKGSPRRKARKASRKAR